MNPEDPPATDSTDTQSALTPRQQRFADLYLSGVSASRAYKRAGFKSNNPANGASRLLAHCEPLQDYIAAERRRMAEESQLQKWQVVDFLCRVITTPAHNLPDDSPLIQEHVTVTSANGDITRVRVKMINKLDAIKQLYLFLGWSDVDVAAPQRSEEEIVSEAFSQMLTDIRAGRA